jgi:hypothetical protein
MTVRADSVLSKAGDCFLQVDVAFGQRPIGKRRPVQMSLCIRALDQRAEGITALSGHRFPLGEANDECQVAFVAAFGCETKASRAHPEIPRVTARSR